MHVTVILVGAVRVAVDGTRLSVCRPASVSDAKVCAQLLVQVQRVFLWTHETNHIMKERRTHDDLKHGFMWDVPSILAARHARVIDSLISIHDTFSLQSSSKECWLIVASYMN